MLSPSSRRAWIEIVFEHYMMAGSFVVALLAEGVDRNTPYDVCRCMAEVALLAEGVDRNHLEIPVVDVTLVALLAEGVDRNSIQTAGIRSTWVALLAEGVDRNENEKENIFDGVSVALLAEGVDRNTGSGLPPVYAFCRPPRGGRG